jgi:adenylate cyclase
MVVSTFYLGSLLATAEHDRTIKDYAGDGVLVLMGAYLGVTSLPVVMMVDRLFGEFLPSTLLGVVIACLGGVFFLVARRPRSNAALAVAWVAFGSAVVLQAPFVDRVGSDPTLLERLHAGLEVFVILAGAAYASAIFATARTSATARIVLNAGVRVAYLIALVMLILGIAFPRERLNDYFFALSDPSSLSRRGFWLFAVCWITVLLVFTIMWSVLWRQQIDEAERARAASLAAAIPVMVAGTVLPYEWSLWCYGAANLILLYAQLQFHAAAAERSVFLSRFLSPDVSALVDAHGLAEVMKPHEVELTVVCCDLRGFTAYAEAVPSQAVIDLLEEYYEAVGEAVAEHGGTIKDYAGDGVLVLVGAPLPRADHARAGLALANRLRDEIAQVTDHWSTGIHPLGVGVGVSSGKVTVGAIGSNARMEYTAVGLAVNLASRLCATAVDGEILLDHRTVELARAEGVTSRGSMQVKGMASAQAVYAT